MKDADHNKKPQNQEVIFNMRSAWIILVFGLVITAPAVMYSKSNVDRIARQEFIFECSGIKQKIEERLANHARILRSGASFFDAAGSVTRQQWHTYTDRQKLEQQLPGIQGLCLSILIPREQLARHIRQIRSEGLPEYEIRPSGDRELYSSIIFIEPFSGRNLRAFGYDMLSEPVRRAAMERARDSDSATLSGRVVLVQETGVDTQAGTLMYVPVYRKGMPTETVEERRAAIYGWVYSPYRMNDMMQGIFADPISQNNKQLNFRVFDGEHPSNKSLLYEYLPGHGDTSASVFRFTQRTPVDFNGHRWTLLITQTGRSPFSAEYLTVWLTMVIGTVISLLLFALFRSLITRAEAQRVSESNYRNKNSELERFIYTLSHDLKSPLVTISVFLGYLEVDITSSDQARIEKDIGYIRSAADKMGVTLAELLELFRVGRAPATIEKVRFEDVVGEALQLVAGGISARGVNIAVTESELVLSGVRARLVEIWQNLIENAVKYMGNQVEPRIDIGYEMENGETVFCVRDNGMGIAPCYQQNIFGLFNQLDVGSEGSGLGLALVKRIVETYAGRIWVESEGGGHGSCFRFTLPGAKTS